MTRVHDIYPDNRVSLREVGLRDGLQLVKTFPSTAAKQRWVRDEYAAGVRHFEVGSFLPARTFPQFVDVRDVVATIAALPGAHGVALALNERGVNEALAYVPGVSSNVFGFDPRYDAFYIRGFDVTYTGVYRDGLRELNGVFSLFKTEPYGLEAISVLRILTAGTVVHD